jgi:K+-sensing histidine kinase KdpD
MAPSSKNTAIVFLCRRNGELIDVIENELGLPTGARFESYVAPFDRRKASRFLADAGAKKAILDRKLNVQAGGETIPLFFSAASSGAQLVIVATRARFEPGLPPPGAPRHVRSMRTAFRKLDALSRKQAASSSPIRKRRPLKSDGASTAQLLRLIAHDLTNPISGILAASQFLREDAGHLLDVHQATLLKSIESSSEFALQFIENMLELHLVKSAKLHIRPQPTDVAKLVAECTESFRARAAHKRITLESKSVGPAPIVELDRQRGAQAIGALIRNELECLEPGSTVQVTVTGRKDGAEVTISGEGIRPSTGAVKAILEEIRGAPSKGGLNEIRTALTLSAVSRIVEAHHGSVRKEDRQAGGPTFTVCFPAAVQPPSRQGCVPES